MDKNKYDKYRILTYIKKEQLLTRSKLTRQGLARFPHLNMSSFYRFINDMEDDGLITQFKEHIPNRRGPNPKVYQITDLGLAWLKVENKEVKKTLRRLA